MLLVAALFVAGFAFSFYILLHGDSNQAPKFFQSPGNAMMKTFVMLTGEFGTALRREFDGPLCASTDRSGNP